MTPISRKEQSSFIDSLIEKKAFGIERISDGPVRGEDPFKDKVDGDVWFIMGNKLVRNNDKGVKND